METGFSMMDLNFSFTGNFSTGFYNADYFLSNSSIMSDEDIRDLIRQMVANNSLVIFDQNTLTVLIFLFVLLIVFGATGNGFVCYVVARNRRMVTPRNIFIINLAISDLTLCLFTQPFNLMRVCTTRWTLGEFMCKFVPVFTGVNVFVSTISIASIALDRFQVVVFPTNNAVTKWRSFFALASIWLVAFLMASPLLAFSRIKPFEPVKQMILYYTCIENTQWHYEKASYSVACMLFQYVVPIILISIAHWKICKRVRYRMVNQQVNSPTSLSLSLCQIRRRRAEARRKRRTTMLLLLIALVFAFAWLPLNICNILADMNHDAFLKLDSNKLVFPVCHLFALLSACTNPVLYGWLNDNFRKEFIQVLHLTNCSKGGAELSTTTSHGTERTTLTNSRNRKQNNYSVVNSTLNDNALTSKSIMLQLDDSSPNEKLVGDSSMITVL